MTDNLLCRGLLTLSCIAKSGSDEDLQTGLKRPVSPGPGKQGATWTGPGRARDEDDGFDENYFRRRPKSFYFQQAGAGARVPPVTNLAEEAYYRQLGGGGYVVRGGYPGYSPAPGQLARPELCLSQDTLASQHSHHSHATQPNTPDLLLHRKAVSSEKCRGSLVLSRVP